MNTLIELFAVLILLPVAVISLFYWAREMLAIREEKRQVSAYLRKLADDWEDFLG